MESELSNWKQGIRYASKTDLGLRRSNNQDSASVHVASSAKQWLSRGHLFVVADGMGAHVAGEVASRLAVDTVTQSFLKQTSDSIPHALQNGLYEAHRLIREKSEDAYRNMGTTCDAFVMSQQGLYIAHVGDSRTYRVRNNQIDQMTFDHSLVWEVCLATRIPFDQAPSHIPKNQITRSLGPTEKLVVDLEGPHPILIGDKYISCSDGLTGQVSDREIGEILVTLEPEDAAEILVNLANLRGGHDNITMVIAEAIHDAAAERDIERELQLSLSSILLLFASIISGACSFIGYSVGSSISTAGGMILSGLFAVLAIVFAILFWRGAKNALLASTCYMGESSQSGRGPYTHSQCEPSLEFAGKLASILKELEEAARNQNLKIASSDSERLKASAEESARNRNAPFAIKSYTLAINALMREIKAKG